MYGLIFWSSKGRAYRRGIVGYRAFTLVELLVVVAIIALLVSILLPTLGKAKEQTRTVICMSNLKSLGLGFTFYTNENNNWWPAGAADGGDDEYTWDSILQPYYQQYGLLHCPSNQTNRDYDGYGQPVDWRYPRSYAINRDVSWMGPSSAMGSVAWPGGVHKTTDVTIPNETILVGEMWWSQYWSASTPGMYHTYPGCGIFIGWGPGRFATTDVHRNEDMANYFFCDGHVTSILADEEKLLSPDYYYWRREK